MSYGGAGGELWTGASLSSSVPLFLDRIPEAIGSVKLNLTDGGVGGFSLPFASTFFAVGGPLALLDPHDHRSAIVTLAQPVFRCWRATRYLVEALTTCVLTGPAVVPPMSIVGTPMPPAVWDGFFDRFNVPLRQGYSSTETGPIALDASPADRVQRDTVGRPLGNVEIRIGDQVIVKGCRSKDYSNQGNATSILSLDGRVVLSGVSAGETLVAR